MGDMFELPENSGEMKRWPGVKIKNDFLQERFLADSDGKLINNYYFEKDYSVSQPDMDVKNGDTVIARVPGIKNAEGDHRMKLMHTKNVLATESDIGPAEEAMIDRANKREEEFVYIGSGSGVKFFPKEPKEDLIMEKWPAADVYVLEKTGHQSPEVYMEKWEECLKGTGKPMSLVKYSDLIPDETYKKMMRRDIEIDGDDMIYHISEGSETMENMLSFLHGLPLGPDHRFKPVDTDNVMKAVDGSLRKHDVQKIEVERDKYSMGFFVSNEDDPAYGVAQRIGTYLLNEEGETSIDSKNAEILSFK